MLLLVTVVEVLPLTNQLCQLVLLRKGALMPVEVVALSFRSSVDLTLGGV